MITAIIVAAGSGTRAKLDKNKVLFTFDDGTTVLERSVKAFYSNDRIKRIVVAASPADEEEFARVLSPYSDKVKIVLGGATRTESVKNALAATDGELVLIHDGARPFVTKKIIGDVIKKACSCGSAVPVLPFVDSLGVGCGKIEKVERGNRFLIQTPQAFDAALIKKAYSMITPDDVFTDDSGVYAKSIAPAEIVEGDKNNKKMTYPEDFAEHSMRIGTGFDLHRLVEGRKLILGGVEVPHTKGLLGHSDADALTHAVMDALLSSVGERDIGYHFPDTDEKYKGANSMKLLERVMEIVSAAGYRPVNVTAVIMAEKPKLMPFVPQITSSLAKALGLTDKTVGITCTTLEGLGIIGEERAIAVRCYALVSKR